MPVVAGVTDEFLRLAMVNQKSQNDDKQNSFFFHKNRVIVFIRQNEMFDFSEQSKILKLLSNFN